MEYIRVGIHEPGCIFCTKPQTEIDSEENLILARGSQAFVMLNLYPYNNGHLLIAPYRHLASLSALTDEESLDVFRLLRESCRILDDVLHPHGYNVGMNLGKVAGAGVPDHLHWHIVPRWGGDTNFMPILADTRVLPDTPQNTYRQLASLFASLSN
jgi:ATP adenylyltransferase